MKVSFAISLCLFGLYISTGSCKICKRGGGFVNAQHAPRLIPNDYTSNAAQFDAVYLPEAWYFMKDKWQLTRNGHTRFPWMVVIDDGFFPTWDLEKRYEMFPGYPDGSGVYPHGSAWGEIPQPGNVITYGFHGTQVMSLLGSKANNVGFIAGIASSWDGPDGESGSTWGPHFYPIRIGNGGIFSTSPSLLVEMFNGNVLAHPEIRVVNISQSLIDVSELPGSDLEGVINQANAKQILIVAGAGNKKEYRPEDTWLSKFENVMIVGGLNEDGSRLWIEDAQNGTATGPAVDIYAPAQDLSTLIRDRELVQDSGTSFAAPFVSGVVAMMQNLDPSTLNSPRVIKDVIIKTADIIQVGNPTISILRLNAYRAVYCGSNITVGMITRFENGIVKIIGEQWSCITENAQQLSGQILFNN